MTDPLERTPQNPYMYHPQTAQPINMLDPNGNYSVAVGDQTTRPLDLYFDQYLNDTLFAAAASKGDRVISVADATDFAVGRLLTMISNATGIAIAGSQAFITGVSGTDISLDRPLDNDFVIGDYVQVSNVNMNVNGSVTPVTFSLKKPTADPDIGGKFDITRIMFQMFTATTVDLGDFGDLTALTNGILFRHVNSRTDNLWTAKTNGEIALLAYDVTFYDASNPAQGVDGLIARLTYAGQEKHGVALRIEEDEDLEILIQDDLTGLTSMNMMAQGHLTN